MKLKDFLEQSPDLFTDLPITGNPLEILLPVIQNLDEFKNCQIELINTKDNLEEFRWENEIICGKLYLYSIYLIRNTYLESNPEEKIDIIIIRGNFKNVIYLK